LNYPPYPMAVPIIEIRPLANGKVDHPHIWGTDELMRYIPFCVVASQATSC
jgi:hypothetical protein